LKPAEPQHKVAVTSRWATANIQGHHRPRHRQGISPSLAKRTVAMALDGTVVDLADPISQDAKIEFITATMRVRWS